MPMNKSAPTPFSFFQTVSRALRKELKRHPEVFRQMLPSHLHPKKLRMLGNIDLLRHAYHELPNSPILSHLIMTEAQWNDTGRNVLFPGAQDFYTRLLDSKFSLSAAGASGLALPFKTFVLATPKEMTYKGLRVPSPIVSYSNNFSDRMAMFRRIDKLLCLGESTLIDEPEDERTSPKVTLFFHNPYDPGEETTSICTMTTSELNRTLSMDFSNLDEFSALLGHYKETHVLDMNVSETDGMIQMLLMRLIAGLSVYLSATDSTVCSDGIPDLRKFGVQGIDTFSKPTAHYIPAPSTTAGSGSSGIMTTRRWHFRRLQDERYYRGEHANRPRGSRWTIVKEATVGHFSPSTINHQ